MEKRAGSRAFLHFLHNRIFFEVSHSKAMQVESIMLLEIPAKLKIVEPQVASSIVIGQQLHIDVYILDDGEIGLGLFIFVFVFLEIFYVIVNVIIVFARGEKKKSVEKVV